MSVKKTDRWIGDVGHAPSAGEASATIVVGNTVMLLLPQSDLREKTLIYNNHATLTVYLGGATVTTGTGIPLIAGGSYFDEPPSPDTSALYAVGTTTTTTDLRVREWRGV